MLLKATASSSISSEFAPPVGTRASICPWASLRAAAVMSLMGLVCRWTMIHTSGSESSITTKTATRLMRSASPIWSLNCTAAAEAAT